MGFSGATCFHTLTTDSRDIEKQEWDVERMGQICAKAEVFADWKASIEKLCSISKRCTYQDQQTLKTFFLKIDSFERHLYQGE